MSRPKLYDRETVLEKATNLFWEKGFEASSLNELEARTGINKYSIYNEFGNKDKLFLACMDNFLKNYCQVSAILAKQPLGLNNIYSFFEYKMTVYEAEFGKGCLVFNSLSEEESISKEAKMKVDVFMAKMKTLYYDCLTAAQKNKEIRADVDCDCLANYLCNYTYGFVNHGMKTMSKDDLRKSLDVALLTVKS